VNFKSSSNNEPLLNVATLTVPLEHTRLHASDDAFLTNSAYAQTEMRLKLLASLLVMAVSGANTVAAAMCASCCDSKSAQNGPAHNHHEMGSPPSNEKSHIHLHGMHCRECPPDSGLSKSSDCSSSLESHAIKEDSASQVRSSRAAPWYIATELVGIQEPTGNPEWRQLDTSQSARDSYSPPAPLRI